MNGPAAGTGRVKYDALPPATGGGRSGWPAEGDAARDLGSIALQTARTVAAAAGLVRDGKVFSLNAPIDAFGHQQWGRTLVRHDVVHPEGTLFFDDVLDRFALQGSSQWDSLGHVGYAAGQWFGGATEDDVRSGRRNTIEHWARRGIAGRGVLLDMQGLWADRGLVLEPFAPEHFTVEDLEAARERSGLEYRSGDILLLHTGFAAAFGELTVDGRTAMELTSPGLAHNESICRYLWDHGFSAVASDNLAVEAFPADFSAAAAPFGAMHRMLIGQLGLALGELWWLAGLVDDCRADNRWEMFVTSAPLHVPGGIGSPANALAIK
ncbi:cyclase family protein [Dactylosporangium sp. CA-092794]|uniref:cyclase family protein n=1 Tax=Dactylosporangium sp. CA-092794 TaxID=3239929 RepID=UPI003D926E6E